MHNKSRCLPSMPACMRKANNTRTRYSGSHHYSTPVNPIPSVPSDFTAGRHYKRAQPALSTGTMEGPLLILLYRTRYTRYLLGTRYLSSSI